LDQYLCVRIIIAIWWHHEAKRSCCAEAQCRILDTHAICAL
jgi:hypothetical protein